MAVYDVSHTPELDYIVIECAYNYDSTAEREMLNYLADYTEFHFNAEEQLQEEIGYPGIKEHKEKHEELRRTVSELHEMLEDQEGPSDAFVDMVNKNVTEWLYYHIKGFDRSVAEYKFMRNNEKLI